MLGESNNDFKSNFCIRDNFYSNHEDKSISSRLESQRKKFLILDLDETLVHHFKEAISHPDLILQVMSENEKGNKQVSQILYVKVRPFVRLFIMKMHKIFNLIVYTAGNVAVNLNSMQII